MRAETMTELWLAEQPGLLELFPLIQPRGEPFEYCLLSTKSYLVQSAGFCVDPQNLVYFISFLLVLCAYNSISFHDLGETLHSMLDHR